MIRFEDDPLCPHCRNGTLSWINANQLQCSLCKRVVSRKEMLETAI